MLATGAAWLSAALITSAHGACVLAAEKTEYLSRGTASSAGTCWVRGNRFQSEGGNHDDRERVVRCLDAVGLEVTVAEFNKNARLGVDPKFGSGASEFKRYGGGPKNASSPTLGTLEKWPFHVVKSVPGSFGTFAGMVADARSRVLRSDGTAIGGAACGGQRPSQHQGSA
ncbi:FAD-binding protein [Paeniglutamicibacter cryotolerans]|uniref:FAD-binding protein n=1 Tax=Paeniglutamicibacter cryotolerans TaxID=670079 RepID=UPI0028AA7E97|nr:FAD-binding protein [Paeniglutamicibacter cryotolerans]